MIREALEALRAELHRRVDEAIDAVLASLHRRRRQVLPPVEDVPLDEVARARAARALRRRGIDPEGA